MAVSSKCHCSLIEVSTVEVFSNTRALSQIYLFYHTKTVLGGPKSLVIRSWIVPVLKSHWIISPWSYFLGERSRLGERIGAPRIYYLHRRTTRWIIITSLLNNYTPTPDRCVSICISIITWSIEGNDLWLALGAYLWLFTMLSFTAVDLSFSDLLFIFPG